MLNTTDKIIKHKTELLNLAEELGNVPKACQVMGCIFRSLSNGYGWATHSRIRTCQKIIQNNSFSRHMNMSSPKMCTDPAKFRVTSSIGSSFLFIRYYHSRDRVNLEMKMFY